MKRRDFLKNLGISSAGIALAPPMAFAEKIDNASKNAGASPYPLTYDKQVLYIGNDIAVTDTTNGKVRGYILRDIYHFLGIPYGADTSGKNRFMPPVKPEPWSNVFPAIWYPNCAPQMMKSDIHSGYYGRFRGFRDHENYDDISENCLGINVWTPGYNDGKKRPVLLWIHGGGWSFGNAIEHDDHNGENLARLGNIVFCSINHRLGPLGYTNLAAVGGDKYAESGNVGALDLVLALEWIRDNIANFGGDPNNITLAGHSGGANKICALTAMPSAKGLFHKAILMSGAIRYLRPKDITQKAGEYIMREAGLNPGEVDKLQQMPWQQYYDIATRAAKKLCNDEQLEDKGLEANPLKIFEPHPDGSTILQNPYYPEACPLAKDIPMIICTSTGEDSEAYRDPAEAALTIEGVRDVLKNKYKSRRLSKAWSDNADNIVDAYTKAFPDKKPFEIMAMIGWHRQRSIAVCDARYQQGGAPVYNAWFNWTAPLHDGFQTAFHPGYPCFWFYNTDLMYTFTGGGPRPRALSLKTAMSLIQFMRTGDPNGGGLPKWPPYTTEKGEVMVLADHSKVELDPDREARKTLPEYIDN